MKYKWFGQEYETYTPVKNKKKLGFLGILAIPFLVTPFTNWAYLGGLAILSKLNPLWVYN